MQIALAEYLGLLQEEPRQQVVTSVLRRLRKRRRHLQAAMSTLQHVQASASGGLVDLTIPQQLLRCLQDQLMSILRQPDDPGTEASSSASSSGDDAVDATARDVQLGDPMPLPHIRADQAAGNGIEDTAASLRDAIEEGIQSVDVRYRHTVLRQLVLNVMQDFKDPMFPNAHYATFVVDAHTSTPIYNLLMRRWMPRPEL